MTSVVIIGGGVVGSATAWHLARSGTKVVLVEQFAPGHDRGSSHGSSRIFRLAYPTQSYVDLATRSLELWRRLETETETKILTLTGAVDHGPLATLEALADQLTTAGRAHELLTPHEAALRWPGLVFETAVLHHPDAGRAHADSAVAAFQTAAIRAGAEIRYQTKAERIAASDDHAIVTLSDHSTLVADRVVIAAGGWLPSRFGDLFPDLPPIRVTQEQPIHLATQLSAPSAVEWPSFIHHEGGELGAHQGIYGLGSLDGIKIGHHGIGPDIDPDHRDRDVPAHDEAALVEYAKRWLPGSVPRVLATPNCLYTTTPDEGFILDRQGPLVLASACSGHGFKHAPAVGEIVAGLVHGRTAPPAEFALSRFA